jgi:hypothetical protein
MRGVPQTNVHRLSAVHLLLAHELSKSQKFLLKIGETRLSGLVIWRVQFCQDRWQSGALPGFNEDASPLAKQHLDER